MKLMTYVRIAFSLLALSPSLSFGEKLALTDSIQRVSTGFPIQPSLSPNGKEAYLLYQINVDDTVSPPINLAAEIFRNKDGKLHSIATLLGDPNFSSIDAGASNKDFTHFTVVDDNIDTQIRIRIFDQNFQQQAIAVFDDFAAGDLDNPSHSGGGGLFSDDGQLVLLSYLIDAAPNNQISVIKVLNAHDLSLVASLQINNGTAGASFLTINKATYITFATYAGDFVFSWDNFSLAHSPSALFVYRLENNSLKFVDSVLLPQQITDHPTVLTHDGEALIGVGTVRADLSDEVTIFADNSHNQSNIRDDAKELRIYRFDGRKLKLAIAKETGLWTHVPTFSPKTDEVLINSQAIDGYPGFFSLYTLSNQKLSSEKEIFASPPFHRSVFSANGKWLLVTGSDQDSELNDINLYKVNIQK